MKDISCPQCNYTTSTKGGLLQHIKNIHEGERYIFCGQCDYTTHRRDFLIKHSNEKQEDNQDFLCKQCDYQTYRESRLRRHVRLAHEQIHDYACSQCDYQVLKFQCPLCNHTTVKTCKSSKGNMNTHIRRAHKPHPCTQKNCNYLCGYDNCDYKATLGGDLKRHIKAVHLKIRLACPYCDHTAPYESGLQSHIKVKHDPSVRDKACDICGYATYQESKLKKHTRVVHEKSKSIVCDVCLRSSSDEFKKLKRHIKLNFFVKPLFLHLCPDCKYQSHKTGRMQNHIKVIHQKIKVYGFILIVKTTNQQMDRNQMIMHDD